MKRWLPPLAVGTAALAVFAPALSNGFVSWDDPLYIIDNPWVRGLSLEHARWALTTTRAGFWQPLTWLSLQLDYSLWGLEPAGFHLTNLLLHAGASILFHFVCLELLAGRTKAAALAALFFAVHPLRVESVVWAAERKGLLCAVLSLTATLAYLSGRVRSAFAAFALSLAAKPAGLTLPFVLLIIETWRARRIPKARALLPLAPFFALSALSSALTYFIANGSGIIEDITPLGPLWRVGRLLYGLVFYPLTTLWPQGLSPYYPPLAWFGRWSWQFAACALLTAGALAAAWRSRRTRPGLTAVAAAYAVMIFPMLGLVQQGLLYAACDRFSYLPTMGFAVLFGAFFAGRGRVATALAVVWLTALGAASWAQCAVWHDTPALWSAAVARAPCAVAYSNLGVHLADAGHFDEAQALLEKALSLDAGHPLIYESLGIVLERRGQAAQARGIWRQGLAAAPSAELSAMLGTSLIKTDIAAGTGLLKSAVLAKPGHASWRVDLGDALSRGGRNAEAKRQYSVALDLEPELGRAHNNLGLMLEREGRVAEAVAHYQAALRDPASRAEAHHNWGNVFLANGQTEDAERHYREAIKLNPGLAQAQVNLGNILARRGAITQAASLYRAALKTNPASIEARANLRAVAPLLTK